MEGKKFAILADLERLTNEKAENFLSPSIHGQVKIKGKFIRDENGKLVPVLVKTSREKTAVQNISLPATETTLPVQGSIWSGFKKLLGKLFIRKRAL